MGGAASARAFLATYGTVLGAVAIFVTFSVLEPNFLSTTNLLNILRQISYLTILSLGFSLALITAELDLSFANVASLAAVVTAGLIHTRHDVWLAVAAGLAIGLAFGLVNGTIVTRLKIPSLIATLATAAIANGFAFMITGGVAFVGRWPEDFLFLGRGRILGVPMLVIWMALAALLALFVIKQTRLGMHMVATGEAEDAARLAGISTRRMKLLGLAFSGLCAGVAAVLLTSSLSSAGPTTAGDFLLTSIAAVLLGMTTIEPGRPNIGGTVVGALTIGMLANGLVLMGAPYYIQDIVLGIIIIGAVSISSTTLARAAFGMNR